jgi:hypothetical protein
MSKVIISPNSRAKPPATPGRITKAMLQDVTKKLLA